MVSQSQLKVSCNISIISPYFLTIYLSSPFGQKLINNAKGHTGVQAIGQPLSSVKKMRIPVPPLSEQHQIGTTLTDWDLRIDKEEEYHKKQVKIKKGLMHDLLAGKVRVNVDASEGKMSS